MNVKLGVSLREKTRLYAKFKVTKISFCRMWRRFIFGCRSFTCSSSAIHHRQFSVHSTRPFTLKTDAVFSALRHWDLSAILDAIIWQKAVTIFVRVCWGNIWN